MPSRRAVCPTPTCSTRARGTASGAARPIVDALEKELAFLGEVFGFETPDVPAMTLD